MPGSTTITRPLSTISVTVLPTRFASPSSRTYPSCRTNTCADPASASPDWLMVLPAFFGGGFALLLVGTDLGQGDGVRDVGDRDPGTFLAERAGGLLPAR